MFGLGLDSSKFFWKASVILITFLSFKGTTHTYLLKILMTHNKKWNPSPYLLINSISTRLVPGIVSLKDEYTLPFSNFLIIGYHNSSAKCLFGFTSLSIAGLSVCVTAAPEDFSSKSL